MNREIRWDVGESWYMGRLQRIRSSGAEIWNLALTPNLPVMSCTIRTISHRNSIIGWIWRQKTLLLFRRWLLPISFREERPCYIWPERWLIPRSWIQGLNIRLLTWPYFLCLPVILFGLQMLFLTNMPEMELIFYWVRKRIPVYLFLCMI